MKHEQRDWGLNYKENVDGNRNKDKVDLTRKNVWTEIQRNYELNHKESACGMNYKKDCEMNHRQ